MNGLLVRVGADQSEGGGHWNGPIDPPTGEFVYVPIPEPGQCRPGLATPYRKVGSHLGGQWPALPSHLARRNAHLDPDFAHLTYGDRGQRSKQIATKLARGDLLAFYAGLRDIHPGQPLVYALIGLLVIDRIVPVERVLPAAFHENAHTRRAEPFSTNDIVVHGQREVSGRLAKAIPIGHYHQNAYRVLPSLLTAWGGLGVSGGYLQRSARLPAFIDATVFYRWLTAHRIPLLQRNN